MLVPQSKMLCEQDRCRRVTFYSLNWANIELNYWRIDLYFVLRKAAVAETVKQMDNWLLESLADGEIPLKSHPKR